MIKRNTESGFSAVELLITLFIAFLFVMMGYQLYSVSMKDGADSRAKAKASNIAYKYLRKHAYGGCNNAGYREGPNSSIPSSEGAMGGATITVNAVCTNTDMLLVTSTVKYGNPVKEVSHATYGRK